MLKIISLAAAACILFSTCAGSGASAKKDAADEAEAAAMAALAAMDGGGLTAPVASGPQSGNQAAANAAAAGTSAAAPGSASTQGASQGAASQNAASASGGPVRAKPAWVDTPDLVFSKQRYVSAVGYGSDRNTAERDALAKLTGVFGQSVQAEMKTISSYSEAVKSGAIQLSGDSSVQNAVSTSAEMDTLVGAEINDVWYDGMSLYYAAAVMEKEKTSALYADLIRSNERIIEGLVTMPNEERNTLDGYSRLLLAGTIADANRIYANVLTVVGDTRGINPAEMKKGDDYRIEASGVVRNIPIGVSVLGDRGDRIKGAFAKAISGAGFRSGGDNSRYMIRAVYSMSEVELPGQTNKFVRYQLNGSLSDAAEGNSVILSYDASGREGHLTIPEAEERAVRAAEGKIPGEFEAVLKNYLSSLVSGRK